MQLPQRVVAARLERIERAAHLLELATRRAQLALERLEARLHRAKALLRQLQLILALIDYAYQRYKNEQDLRMTDREIRDEMKNLQGDPHVVARRKRVQREMVMNRMSTAVPTADVVVTNPTELAIAIKYEHGVMAAPVVVAKGAGVLAQRIRRLALENNIPIVERKPLARLLYKEVEVNEPVPDSSYAAVAEVLAYVYQLKGKKVPNIDRRAG